MKKMALLLTMIAFCSCLNAQITDKLGCVTLEEPCSFSFLNGTAQKAMRGYSTLPLDKLNTKIRTAVIIIHGNRRNAKEYFETVAGVAEANNLLGTTVVIAPHFICNEDNPDGGSLYWTCSGWKDGGPAINDATVYSFTIIDSIIEILRVYFPGIKAITVTGHSAGGQFAQRYAASNTVDTESLGISMRYVVANPSSYLYLDTKRLKKTARCTDENDCPLTAESFEFPYWNADSSEKCTKYNHYKYGLEHRGGCYIGPYVTDGQIRSRYISRKVVYLLGNRDNSRESHYDELDKSCPGDAQGPYMGHDEHPFRLQRGLTFYHYITDIFSAPHTLKIVPGCMHDEACMYRSKEALPVVFQLD